MEFQYATRFLRQHMQAYYPLSDADFAEISKFVSLNHLPRKSFFLEQGQPADRLAFVISGLFRCFYKSDSEPERTRDFAAEGNTIACYGSMIVQDDAYFNIQALEDSWVLEIARDDFESLRRDFPEIDRLIGQLLHHAFYLREKREYQLLTMNLMRQYEEFLSDYVHIADRIPQYLVASYLGVNPVSLSRAISDQKERVQ